MGKQVGYRHKKAATLCCNCLKVKALLVVLPGIVINSQVAVYHYFSEIAQE